MTLQDFKDQVASEYNDPKTNTPYKNWAFFKRDRQCTIVLNALEAAATLFAEHERKEGYKEGWSKGYDIDKTDI